MLPRLSCIALLASVSCLHAGEVERRTYDVRVDNKPAGTHQLVIQPRDDGSVMATLQADVVVRIIITYRYSFRGTEVWKENKLVQLSSATNDNGKKHKLEVESGADGWTVKTADKAFKVTGEPWPTTYWKLPPENQRGPNVTLFDADTGKLINAKMEKVGVEKITLMGKPVECMHYKLSGGVQVDLWYDGQDRMVRQESIEQGHRTMQELSRLQRE